MQLMLRFHPRERLLIRWLIYKNLQCWGIDLFRQLIGLKISSRISWQVSNKFGVVAVNIDPMRLGSSYAFCHICRTSSNLNTCFCFPRLFSMDRDRQLKRRPPNVGGGGEEDTWSFSPCSPILISFYRGPSVFFLTTLSNRGGAADLDP